MLEKLKRSGIIVITTPNKLTEFMQDLYLFIRRIKRTKGKFRDETHISVKTPFDWRYILDNVSDAELKALTNFIMPWFGKRNITIRIPYFGSSTLIVIARA